MKFKNVVLLACVIGAAIWFAYGRNASDAGSFAPHVEQTVEAQAGKESPVLVGRVTNVVDGQTMNCFPC
jgi:hypothetical protein